MKLAKHNETILCVNRYDFMEALRKSHVEFDEVEIHQDLGVMMVPLSRVVDAIEESYVWMRRAEAEANELYWQVLPYVAIANQRGEILTYSRDPAAAEAAGEELGEPGLYNNSSIGFGGHVELMDAVVDGRESDIRSVIRQNIGRELSEELNPHDLAAAIMNVLAVQFQEPQDVVAKNACNNLVRNRVQFVGIIIDDSNAVGRVHLGLLHVLQLDGTRSIQTAEAGLPLFGFLSLDEIQAQANLENWSQMAAKVFSTSRYALKQYRATDVWSFEHEISDVLPFSVEAVGTQFEPVVCRRPKSILVEELELTNVLSGELYSLTAAGIEITVGHGQHADDVVSLEINCTIDHLLPTGMALAGQFLGKVTHHGADEYILNFHRGEMNIHDCQGERLYVLNKIVGTVIQD